MKLPVSLQCTKTAIVVTKGEGEVFAEYSGNLLYTAALLLICQQPETGYMQIFMMMTLMQ